MLKQTSKPTLFALAQKKNNFLPKKKILILTQKPRFFMLQDITYSYASLDIF